jgi:phosphopentomutase
VPGLPQSGTGHTALLTGANAPAMLGRHFGPWVPVSLRPLLEAENLLSRALARGIPCAFANAYPRGFERSAWGRRPAGPPLMARAAGLLVRHQEALAAGDALSSEIVNTAWREHLGAADIPDVTPAAAGGILARMAARHRLTFFAHYATDQAGHLGCMETSVFALERVDDFLGGVLLHLPADTLLVIASDHGNIEALGRSHTLNPALAVLAGPGALALRRGLREITDIPGAILAYLSGAG